jgi:lipoate-protein ligase A
MARDEVLLSLAQRDGGAAVLRLYSFDPPAVTFGFHQDPRDVLDIDALRRDGIEAVRRITGGRALLHAGELTYCVVVPRGHELFTDNLTSAHRDISRRLAEALQSLGVAAALSTGRRRRDGAGRLAPCMVSAGRHEVSARGRKIVASAQRRSAGAYLQHGSILVDRGAERFGRYTRGRWGSIGDGITSVTAETGRTVARDEVAAAVAGAFAKAYRITWERRAFSAAELDLIAARRREKELESAAALDREVSRRC